jgi:hypothetical protein
LVGAVVDHLDGSVYDFLSEFSVDVTKGLNWPGELRNGCRPP